MSWYFPPRPVIASEFLDIDAWNLNFGAVHAELGGELNEHNFEMACLDGAEAKWADDIALDIAHITQELDPYNTATQLDVPVTMTWTPVDGSDRSYTTAGGKVLVIYSFQMTSATAATRQPGQNFCIEIDGIPYIDCLIGGGDQTNDWVQVGAYKFEASGVAPSVDPAGGPGFKGDHRAYVCEMVAVLPPGEHTFRLLSRNIDTVDGTIYQKVSNVEGIVALMYA